MSTNHFSRMLRYATEGAIVARENFSTELLALAINTDGSPLAAVLRNRGLVPTLPLRAETQVHIQGVGVIDLVLRDSNSLELWIEVKVWAPESGDQLQRYVAGANDSDNIKVAMLTVGQRPSINIPWFTWHDIHMEIEENTEASYLWRELAAFIRDEEYGGMKTMPIEKNELASLGQARNVLIKINRLQKSVWEEVQRRNLKWFNRYDGDVVSRKFIGEVYIRIGEVLCQFDAIDGSPAKSFGADWPAYLLLGFANDEFIIAVESSSLEDILGESIEKLERCGWELNGDRIRRRSHELVTATEREAVTWVLERMEELESTGAREAMARAHE